MIWFTVDNGPEVNCKPEGRCGSGKTGRIPDGTLHRPACGGAGSAGPLRGRKRDVWEGGHRVPGIVSWPAVAAGGPRTTWDTVVTMDFHATVMEVLNVSRPAAQRDWHYDGVSILPILKVIPLLQFTTGIRIALLL
jgi:arylsulfatase A-like enzyme